MLYKAPPKKSPLTQLIEPKLQKNCFEATNHMINEIKVMFKLTLW